MIIFHGIVYHNNFTLSRKIFIYSSFTKKLSPYCVAFYEEDSTAERDERLAMLCEDFLENALNLHLWDKSNEINVFFNETPLFCSSGTSHIFSKTVRNLQKSSKK